MIKGGFLSGYRYIQASKQLNLNIGKKKGYNNKTLVSKTGIKIDSNKDINWDHKKLPPDVSIPLA